MSGILYIVSTPIGNLGDMTHRAVKTLRGADLIACEDTRTSGKLLKEYGISGRLLSYHEHNEIERTREILDALEAGLSVAVISDAGTPGIADPGFRAVEAAINAGVTVVSVPGPSALAAAISISGLPADSVYFGGFLPSRKGERIRRLSELKSLSATLVFYESPHRVHQSLSDCLEVLGNRRMVLAREITKLHEECLRGRISEILDQTTAVPVKGEIVLLFDRPDPDDAGRQLSAESAAERYNDLIKEGMDQKKALRQTAKELGLSRSETYRLIHTIN